MSEIMQKLNEKGIGDTSPTAYAVFAVFGVILGVIFFFGLSA